MRNLIGETQDEEEEPPTNPLTAELTEIVTGGLETESTSNRAARPDPELTVPKQEPLAQEFTDASYWRPAEQISIDDLLKEMM